MTLMDKQALFAAAVLPHEDVPVPGGLLRIGSMTALGRDAFLGSSSPDGDLSDFQARLVLATAVDEQGDLVFASEDIPRLRRLPPLTLNKLADTAARLNGIGKGAVEQAEKNFEAAPSGDSPSDSPSPTESL